MLIYYICSKPSNKKSFEYKLANEIQRNGFDLWSQVIDVTLGDYDLYNDMDDKLGDTTVAIVVIDENFENEAKEFFMEAVRYSTISFVFVLNNVSKMEFKENILKNNPTLNEKVNWNVVFEKNDGLKNITSNIGIYISKINKDIKERVSTGIPALDYLLAGGLIKASACNIIGPSGSGKTTLGLQFQKAGLEAGYGCLFITYSEAPIKILRRMEELGCDITNYINNGKYRIYDSYSSLNGLTSEEVCESVGEKWYSAIIRVENPYDAEAYFKNQIKAIEELGPGGVNIIDNSNIRYEIAQKQKKEGGETYKEHFSRFKAKAGDSLRNIGVHIVEEHEELIAHLTRIEDGSIRLKHVEDGDGNVTRWLRVEDNGQIGRGDNKWYEYVITSKGLKLLPTDFDSEVEN